MKKEIGNWKNDGDVESMSIIDHSQLDDEEELQSKGYNWIGLQLQLTTAIKVFVHNEPRVFYSDIFLVKQLTFNEHRTTTSDRTT